MASGKSPRERLQAFLADPARDDGTLSYHSVQGFLFSVASAPEMVMPSDWMPVIFGGEEPAYASIAEVKAIVGGLMAMYNEINEGVMSALPTLPPDCRFRRATLANLDDDAPVSQWARGFAIGHHWLNESWEEALPTELDEVLGTAVMALTFFTSRRFAETLLAETVATDLRTLAGAMRRLFPGAMSIYAQVGRGIYSARVSGQTIAAVPMSRQKLPPNARCYCGSGKKYKNCHGAG